MDKFWTPGRIEYARDLCKTVWDLTENDEPDSDASPVHAEAVVMRDLALALAQQLTQALNDIEDDTGYVYITMWSKRSRPCSPSIGRVYKTLEGALSYFDIEFDDFVRGNNYVFDHFDNESFGRGENTWVHTDDKYNYYIEMRKVDEYVAQQT